MTVCNCSALPCCLSLLPASASRAVLGTTECVCSSTLCWWDGGLAALLAKCSGQELSMLSPEEAVCLPWLSEGRGSSGAVQAPCGAAWTHSGAAHTCCLGTRCTCPCGHTGSSNKTGWHPKSVLSASSVDGEFLLSYISSQFPG